MGNRWHDDNAAIAGIRQSANHPSSPRRRGSIAKAVSILRESAASMESRLRGNDGRSNAASIVRPQALLMLTHCTRIHNATVSQAIDPPARLRAAKE